MTEIAESGSASGSISQRHGSADPDPGSTPKFHGSGLNDNLQPRSAGGLYWELRPRPHLHQSGQLSRGHRLSIIPPPPTHLSHHLPPTLPSFQYWMFICSPGALEDFIGSSAPALTSIRLDSCHVATGSVLGMSIASHLWLIQWLLLQGAVFWIRIRIRTRIRMFLVLPDPLVTGTDPESAPDPSIVKQK